MSSQGADLLLDILRSEVSHYIVDRHHISALESGPQPFLKAKNIHLAGYHRCPTSIDPDKCIFEEPVKVPLVQLLKAASVGALQLLVVLGFHLFQPVHQLAVRQQLLVQPGAQGKMQVSVTKSLPTLVSKTDEHVVEVPTKALTEPLLPPVHPFPLLLHSCKPCEGVWYGG